MRILIVDDSSVDRELIIRRLRKEQEFANAEFVEVSQPEHLEKALLHDHFDIALTDYQLNWTTGLQVLQQFKQRYPDIPVLMVTGTGNEEVAVEGLQTGLSNYILKNHLDRLPNAVRESLEKTRLQKQYEDAIEQLRRSEERYRDIFEQGLTAIFAAQPDGSLLTCNTAFVHIFGFPSADVAMTTNLQDLYPDPEQYAKFLEIIKREKRLEYYESQMLRADGTPLYVVENVRGSFDQQSHLIEIQGYLFDNTERKKLTEQLHQAQRLESVGLLVSGIAHDFNNMLGGILGYTNRSLAKMTYHHPLYENLNHIQEIATRASKMTQQLLAFSRRQVLETMDVSLNVVIENLLSFLGKLLADRVEIEFLPDENLQTVRVDYAQIEQVIMNLCVNAHDAMPDGGKLTIRTTNMAAEDLYPVLGQDLDTTSYALISVKDTGIGMDEATRSQIFEPFFTTKETGKGTGLGLSVVHGIIAQHNGFIRVESAPGQGTTFFIYLPSIDAPAQIIPLTGNTREMPEVRGGSETILVVEDDPDLRCLMEETLSEYGYRVISAADGFEGLNLFKEHHDTLALVVSDLITPRMKGKELYDQVHALNPEMKFLFVSGYQANQISQNFVLDQEFELLQKPFDLDELAAKVRTMLG